MAPATRPPTSAPTQPSTACGPTTPSALTPAAAAVTRTVEKRQAEQRPRSRQLQVALGGRAHQPGHHERRLECGLRRRRSTRTASWRRACRQQDPKTLTIQCTAGTGEGLVVLKNILWPIPAHQGHLRRRQRVRLRREGDLRHGRRHPGGQGGHLDQADGRFGPHPASPNYGTINGSHLQLASAQTITVEIDELKANHHTSAVDGQEWLVAEVSDVDGVVGPDLLVAWDPASVTIDQGGARDPVARRRCLRRRVHHLHGQRAAGPERRQG